MAREGGSPGDWRMALYKPSSPPWKEAYVQRCRESLRARRSSFLEAIRSGGGAPSTAAAAADRRLPSADHVAEIMTEEWEQMRRTNSQLPSAMSVLLCTPGSGEGEDELEQALTIIEQIQKELRDEEERILAECWQSSDLSEALLCEAMQNLDTDEVCCPVCRRHNLLQNKAVVFCPCGVRVDTEQDCLSMAQIRQHIMAAVSAHESVCSGQNEFSMLSAAGFQNVVLSCEKCDFMQVVI